MNIKKTNLIDAYIIEPNVFGDNRGYFMESYNSRSIEEQGLMFNFVQDNQSLSAESGTIRGLHYQLEPYAQTKLIRVLHGAIYDVIVDIRKKSPTYGKWQGFILSEDNKQQLLVPKGFAHGFCTIVKDTEVFYKVDNYFSPEHDRGIQWNDPKLNIIWPIKQPILSAKDQKHPTMAEAENNFTYKG